MAKAVDLGRFVAFIAPLQKEGKSMAGNADIREKLAKLEALFARGATAGNGRQRARRATGYNRNSLPVKTKLASQTLHKELTAYFDETVEHLIADAMKSDGEDGDLEQRQIPN